MTSITSLPTEIVVQILSSASTEEPWLLYQLGHVCGGWRAIVEDSPRFWANVVANTWYFPNLSQHDMLASYCDAIRRSAPHLLAVSVDLSMNSMASRAYVSRNFVDALLPYGQRLSSVALVVDGKTARSLHHLLHRGLPNLEELAVTICGSDSMFDCLSRYQLYQFPEREALSRLHTLRTSGVLLGPWLAGPSLAHLHVTGVPQDDDSRVLSWGLFIQVLEHCPLKTLKLCDALPMLVWPEETEMLLGWPGSGALQALRNCIVQDKAAAIMSFSMFLCTAPLPLDALLDITFTSSKKMHCFSDNIFSLAFCRGPPHLTRRVELDKSLRVYVGDKKLTEMKLPLPLVPSAPESLAHALFLDMPFDLQVRDRQAQSIRADPDVTELVLTLDLHESIRLDLWTVLFTLLPGLLRIELRFSGPPTSLHPDQLAALSQGQSRTTASLLAYLSSRTAADGYCALLLLEGLHIHGLRLEEQHAHDLSQKIVSSLAAQANDHGPALKHLTLQCVGTPPPSLELLPMLVGDGGSRVVLC
ncbi:hypothetical protein OH76DRAFT_1559306 [Lentinus brumalis]|uniref:F-box domain-containing protein n=1 Tax=Lentinus brumalis TaxID=2498619 RepID=A0A371CXY6_9APHY|nr:hypothetical protein OH76DRAFT_1559306 [Polyporus brumalis]